MGQTRGQKTLEMEERRRKVAALYLAHVTQTEIATRLGLSQPTVSRDVEAIRREYRQAREELIDREAAGLDAIERDCVLQYQATKAVEWIRARLETKQRRAKLLGLDAPQKVAPTNPEGDGPAEIRVRWDDDDPIAKAASGTGGGEEVSSQV